MSKMAPAMHQYYTAKKEYSNALVFFRMGDFYESFGVLCRRMIRSWLFKKLRWHLHLHLIL